MVAPKGDFKLGAVSSNTVKAQKTFTPVSDLVAVQWWRMDQTAGGVQLPDISVDNRNNPIGLVIAVGPKVEHIKEGDVVVGPLNGIGAGVNHGGQPFIVCVPENYLVGVVTEEYKGWRPGTSKEDK